MTALESPASTPFSHGPADTPPLGATKPRRVRTGCLTCRERHLKCDEGLPNCQNCVKSGKACRRGVKLNFHWIDVKSPDILPPTANWSVQFQDESRHIASEYKGGIAQYRQVDQAVTPPYKPALEYDLAVDQDIPLHTGLAPVLQPTLLSLCPDEQHSRASNHSFQTEDEALYLSSAPSTSHANPGLLLTPSDSGNHISDPEELLFMQIFVEEVGIWMDGMDPMEQFSRLLPFYALQEPMLLYAFLACGARQFTLVNAVDPVYYEDKALSYHDTATAQLLRALQDPNRNATVCATTASILSVYETISERAQRPMNHIAGARALVRECGWNARSSGLGAACFWLSISMELLSCLQFNWQTAWDPDHWGVDMDFSHHREPGNEEIWVHRMLYITAKTVNFRAATSTLQDASGQEEQVRRQSRYAEWQGLKGLCDSWNRSIPRTMHQLGYRASTKSLFPEVWLIKRSTIAGRLFYHMSLCLIAQTNPLLSSSSREMFELLLDHAHQICGIVAHVKERGVAPVCLCALAIAASALVQREEQEDALRILARIGRESGWDVEALERKLSEKWGWDAAEQLLREQSSVNQFLAGSQAEGSECLSPAPQGSGEQDAQKVDSGIVNPVLAKADFSLPDHPYQAHYQPSRVPDVEGQQYISSLALVSENIYREDGELWRRIG